jgi:hypothetical protein
MKNLLFVVTTDAHVPEFVMVWSDGTFVVTNYQSKTAYMGSSPDATEESFWIKMYWKHVYVVGSHDSA